MDKEEFFKLYAGLMQMSESENPALYQRKMRCVDRLHKLHAEGWKTKIPSMAWFFPPAVDQCPDCTPSEKCWTHELLDILTEYKTFGH
jgi:hypothetical protein